MSSSSRLLMNSALGDKASRWTIEAAKVAGAVMSAPGDIPAYIKLSVLRRSRSTLDLGVPWFSFSAIRFLEGLLSPQMTVYEYGSGGSTIFLARRVRNVISIENDSRWMTSVENKLCSEGLVNADIRFARADFSEPANFLDSEFARALPEDPADIVVLDSFDYLNGHPLRPLLFADALRRVKLGGVLIVDDSWRYTELRNRRGFSRAVTQAGVGPARRPVTSTDFFFKGP
jgi:SAM-dependent methyltransferase